MVKPYIDMMQWSPMLNIGMSFNRTIWKKIQKCSDIFCDLDETNWDITLEHVVNKCLKYLDTMALRTTRVFHLGNW